MDEKTKQFMAEMRNIMEAMEKTRNTPNPPGTINGVAGFVSGSIERAFNNMERKEEEF